MSATLTGAALAIRLDAGGIVQLVSELGEDGRIHRDEVRIANRIVADLRRIADALEKENGK